LLKNKFFNNLLDKSTRRRRDAAPAGVILTAGDGAR